MSREQKYTAIILKKQPFGESDEIITFYSIEHGKIRGLAKSVKSAKSKLQQKLQALFLVNLTLAGSKLPKIISVETREVFPKLRESLQALKMAFYAVEIVLKATADEEKNQQLYDALESFLRFLDQIADEQILNLGLVKFQLLALSALGLGLSYNAKGQNLVFSPVRGGFFPDPSADSLKISPTTFEAFLKISQTGFSTLAEKKMQIGELEVVLSNFITYQLERKIKSEKFLKS